MSSTNPGKPTFRKANVEEDEWLSRILCNAFLPLWNHNWFHGVSEALDPIDTDPDNIHAKVPMSRIQDVRRRLYLALIKLTRAVGGQILLAEVLNDKGEEDAGAILLWQPPFKHMTHLQPWLLYQTGFLSLLMPWNYGLAAYHRVEVVFEGNIKKMFDDTLKPRGISVDECGFIQMIAANPRYPGRGYASTLLDWQMKQHFKDYPQKPVILDTTTEQGIRAYKRLGFELLAQTFVNTGTDADGLLLKPDASEEVKEKASKVCVQSVMVKMPPTASD